MAASVLCVKFLKRVRGRDLLLCLLLAPMGSYVLFPVPRGGVCSPTLPPSPHSPSRFKLSWEPRPSDTGQPLALSGFGLTLTLRTVSGAGTHPCPGIQGFASPLPRSPYFSSSPLSVFSFISTHSIPLYLDFNHINASSLQFVRHLHLSILLTHLHFFVESLCTHLSPLSSSLFCLFSPFSL